MTVTYRDGVAILALIFSLPALVAAIFLTFRHGFGRSSGWIFLIVFALIRIIGACLQIATINDPHNMNLYIGTAILNTIGLSPLVLVALGLLSRAVSNIQKSYTTFLQPHHIKLIQLIVTVGFILGIIGGVKSSDSVTPSGSFTTQPLSQAAMGLFIVAYVLLVVSTILTFPHISHAEQGERRLVQAILISLPLLLVRLVYSSISIFSNNADFSSLTGNVTIFLCMAVIMEIIVVILYATVGLNLKRADYPPISGRQTVANEASTEDGYQVEKRPAFSGTSLAGFLGQRTFIGRFISRNLGNQDNVRMGRAHGGRRDRREVRRQART